ncbi:uncharacterized protein LOC143058310 isoform X2 [Mytilus galloprovincialis]|uniref:uncharacterized protein LOC143058310 isoform X2 n=1 Tax=Mytilus galloprovincialis TaxID=29158 RepID=UPI003F7C08E0
MHNGQGTPTELNMTVNSVGASNNTGSPSPGMHNGQGTPTGRNTKLNSSGASNNTGSPTSGMHNGQGTHIQNLHGTPTNNMKAASNNPPGSGSPVVPTSSGASSVPRGRIGSYLLPNELRVSFTLGNDTIHLDLLKNRQFGRHAVPVFTKFSDGSIVQHGLSAVKHVGSYYTDKDHTHNLHLECMSNSSSTCTHYKIFGSFEHNSDMHLIEPKVQPIDLGNECEHLHRIVKTDHIDGVKIDHLTLTGVKNSPAPTSLPANKNNSVPPQIDMIPSNKSNSMPMTNASTAAHENNSAPATIMSTPANNNTSAAPTNITKISTNNEHHTHLAITSLPTKRQHSSSNIKNTPAKKKKRGSRKTKSVPAEKKLASPKAMEPKQAKHLTLMKITSIPSKSKRPISKGKSLPMKIKIPTPKKITSIPVKKKTPTPKSTSLQNDRKKRPTPKNQSIQKKTKHRIPKKITSIQAKKTPPTPKNTTSQNDRKNRQSPKNKKKKHRTPKKITSTIAKKKHSTPKKNISVDDKKKSPAPQIKPIQLKKKQPAIENIKSIPARTKHRNPKKIPSIQNKKKRPFSNLKVKRVKNKITTPQKITSILENKNHSTHLQIKTKQDKKKRPALKLKLIPTKKKLITPEKITSVPAKKTSPITTIKYVPAKKKKLIPMKISSLPGKVTHPSRKKINSKRVKKNRKFSKIKSLLTAKKKHPKKIKSIPIKKKTRTPKKISSVRHKKKSPASKEITSNKQKSSTSDRMKSIQERRLSSKIPSKTNKGLHGKSATKQKADMSQAMSSSKQLTRKHKRRKSRKIKGLRRTKRPKKMMISAKNVATKFKRQRSPQRKKQMTVKNQRSQNSDMSINKRKRKKHHNMVPQLKPSTQSSQPKQLDNPSSKPWASIPGLQIPIDDVILPFGQSNHRRKRATGNYNVEVFVVIDSPIYNFWLREENSNSDRAMQRVREYYTFLLLGVDNRFKKMSAPYRIGVNLVGIYVAKRSSDLSFIQNHLSGGILNADTALSAMKQWVQTNGIPRHDHIMTFTRYDMRSGSFDTSGTAYLNSICTTRSNSIVEEKFDFIAATVAAHEIGHALGAVHDGENNRCSASSGFIMVSISQALRPPNQKSPWQFSSCTSREIGLYLDELNKKGSHCMQRAHPNAKNFNPGSQKKLGQTFDVDKQCEFIIGKGSYACRSFIGNSENVCTGLWCKTLDMTSTRCILGLPAEGTTCGSNKWCIGSSCVFDSRAPSRRRADCVFGDSPGSVLRGKTCSNLLRSEPFQCYSDSIKKNCCVSCEKVKTGIPNCDYGDKSTDCQRAKSLGQCSRFRSVCCQTCRNS